MHAELLRRAAQRASDKGEANLAQRFRDQAAALCEADGEAGATLQPQPPPPLALACRHDEVSVSQALPVAAPTSSTVTAASANADLCGRYNLIF